MMKKIRIILPILALFAIFSSCETYPDWKEYVEYSDTYPVSGDWYVNDYMLDANGADSAITEPYSLYIYNKAYNPTKDSVWIDSNSGHPLYESLYKIKCKANIEGLTFNCENQGNVAPGAVNPVTNAKTVTISGSKITDFDPGDIESAKADEITFKVTIKDSNGLILKEFTTKGHRKTGWENPNFTDPM